jgi:hypothetical protein
MGIRCIKPEIPLEVEEPVFLYMNMIKMKKNMDLYEQFNFF